VSPPDDRVGRHAHRRMVTKTLACRVGPTRPAGDGFTSDERAKPRPECPTHMSPSPSLGAPLLSPSMSPPFPCGMGLGWTVGGEVVGGDGAVAGGEVVGGGGEVAGGEVVGGGDAVGGVVATDDGVAFDAGRSVTGATTGPLLLWVADRACVLDPSVAASAPPPATRAATTNDAVKCLRCTAYSNVAEFWGDGERTVPRFRRIAQHRTRRSNTLSTMFVAVPRRPWFEYPPVEVTARVTRLLDTAETPTALDRSRCRAGVVVRCRSVDVCMYPEFSEMDE